MRFPNPHPRPPPDDDPQESFWLEDWKRLRREPVLLSFDDTEHAFILAWLRRTPVRFRYWGGTSPGAERQAHVQGLFRLDDPGPVYAEAQCHLRQTERCFRLDRVELLPS